MESNALSPASALHVIPDTGPRPDQAREHAALASMIDAVYCVDTSGRFTFVNTAFETMTGYALADLQGTPSTRLYGPEVEALFAERRRQVYSGATVSPYVETVLILKDGRQLPVELTVSSLIMEGQIAGRVVVLRDGQVVGELAGAEIAPDAMIRLMIGRDLKALYIEPAVAPGASTPR